MTTSRLAWELRRRGWTWTAIGDYLGRDRVWAAAVVRAHLETIVPRPPVTGG